MGSLKDLFMEIGDEDIRGDEDAVEVYADSVKQALDLASRDLGVDVTMLDYEILEKGARGLFGIGRQPYRVLVRPIGGLAAQHDVDEIEKKLITEHHAEFIKPDRKNADGSFKIRVTKTGIWLTVNPPLGKGRPADLMNINSKLMSMKITPSDPGMIQKELKKASGKPVRIGEWRSNPQNDGSMSVEVSDDEMRAYVHFTPPRFSGRHMEYSEVMDALRSSGVVSGVLEEKVKDYLENMDYTSPLLAAEGTRPKNGSDAYIDYKVSVDKSGVNFEEDESGKVDFKNLELLENVVVGQLLAVKVSAEAGIPGRTLTNRILPAKSGKDIKILHGKGTILSEDGIELSAEINGQVVYKNNKLSVEPIFVVKGDVSLETGNIIFLGSVLIAGSVQDNFTVKAAGNIEVKGTVQKAFLEAEGDVIVYQGIVGREEAKIESTGGSVYAKFIQNATVIAEKEVIVPEGVLHSRVDAGDRIFCTGRRARIVGGIIRAGSEVNARFLGADVSTKTEIWVGVNPKVLQQMSDLEELRTKSEEELTQVKLNLRTLETQKKTSGKLSPEREKMLNDLIAQNAKLAQRLDEIKSEMDELNSYVGMLEHKGRVCAEKTAFPGVEVYIKDKRFVLKDPYNWVKFSLEGNDIRLSEYEPPEGSESKFYSRRRRR
ncbi:MAG: FapA family protein [Spirochaetes bacterium]|jgi:hypothetical protein|nr:FapA family protein [Spirochaetota bacterium]